MRIPIRMEEDAKAGAGDATPDITPMDDSDEKSIAPPPASPGGLDLIDGATLLFGVWVVLSVLGLNPLNPLLPPN